MCVAGRCSWKKWPEPEEEPDPDKPDPDMQVNAKQLQSVHLDERECPLKIPPTKFL